MSDSEHYSEEDIEEIKPEQVPQDNLSQLIPSFLRELALCLLEVFLRYCCLVWYVSNCTRTRNQSQSNNTSQQAMKKTRVLRLQPSA